MVVIHVDENQWQESRHKIFWLRDEPARRIEAINNALAAARQVVIDDIAKDVLLPRSEIESRVKFTPATTATQNCTLTISDGAIPVKKFGPVQKSRGVAYRPTRSGRQVFIRHAFGPEIRRLGGNVYVRTGSKRLPIRKVFGKSLADLTKPMQLSEKIKADFTYKLAIEFRKAAIRQQEKIPPLEAQVWPF